MPRAAIQAYRQSAAQGASRGELLLAFYDGALRYLARVRQAILARDIQTKSKYVDATLAVLGELQATLEHRRAPELCDNLDALYSTCMVRLQHAGLKLEVAGVDEIVGYLKTLRGAWAEAVAQQRQEAAAPAPAP